MEFQCSSASRKFLNLRERQSDFARRNARVSVLFSEPKISQSYPYAIVELLRVRGFSALQRAENFSIHIRNRQLDKRNVSVLFSEPKISQSGQTPHPFAVYANVSVLFSEPKISQSVVVTHHKHPALAFQCSSASRKFLNLRPLLSDQLIKHGFSALQRAENFSIAQSGRLSSVRLDVSVLFSEPKISQFRFLQRSPIHQLPVSVLFSEPKISQSLIEHQALERARECFSALQRAENFSILNGLQALLRHT